MTVLPALRVMALTPSTPREFLDTVPIESVDSDTLGMIERVPQIYLSSIASFLRKTPEIGPADLAEKLAAAAKIFKEKRVCGLTPAQYSAAVSELSGLPETVVSASINEIADSIGLAPGLAKLGIPIGAPLMPSPTQSARGVGKSRRRGELLAVIAPGNGPGTHGLWPQAVALGFKVIVRPSEREPLTAQRVVESMRRAGLGGYVALAPCSHSSVDYLIDVADLAVVYGADDIVERYGSSPNVLVQGPGRSKILIGSDQSVTDALPLAFESITSLGGAACVCASAILVEGDHRRFARELSDYAEERFADVGFRASAVPRIPQRLSKWFDGIVSERQDILVQEPGSEYVGDRRIRSAPLVHCVDSAYHPLLQQELPVASVVVAPFDRDRDVPAIEPALVLSVLTADRHLLESIDELVGVRNVYVGAIPTTWMNPSVPHDGFLSEFLMRTIGYREVIDEEIPTS